MTSKALLGPVFSLGLMLAACGGSASPASSVPASVAPSVKPAASVGAPASSAAASASAKPAGAASGAASSKPAASGATAASAKPAASAASASAKPAAAGAASAAGSAAAKPAASGGQIKAAFGVLSTASDPIFAAQDLGLFTKNGINVELSSLESAAVVQAVVAGSINLATGSTVNAINAIASGADLRSVASMAQSSSLMVVSKPDIATVADLKGKTLAVTTPLSSSDFVTRLVLQKNGLAYNKDVMVLTAGTAPAQAAAFTTGQVQAMTVPVDVANGLPAGSYKILVNMPEQHVTFSEQSLLANGPWSRANPDLVAAYIKSYFEGAQAIRNDFATFSQVQKKHLENQTDEQLKAGYDVFHTVWADPANPRVSPESVQVIFDLLGADNAKIKALKYEDVVDNTFVQRLKAAGVFANGGCQGC